MDFDKKDLKIVKKQVKKWSTQRGENIFSCNMLIFNMYSVSSVVNF